MERPLSVSLPRPHSNKRHCMRTLSTRFPCHTYTARSRTTWPSPLTARHATPLTTTTANHGSISYSHRRKCCFCRQHAVSREIALRIAHRRLVASYLEFVWLERKECESLASLIFSRRVTCVLSRSLHLLCIPCTLQRYDFSQHQRPTHTEAIHLPY